METIVMENRWARVTIYPNHNNRTGYTSYCVAWREGKHRQRAYRSDLGEARKLGAETLVLLSEGRSALDNAKKEELLPLKLAQSELERLGVSFEQVLDYYKKHALKPTPQVPTVAELSAEYQKSLEEQGLSLVHRRTVKYHMVPFCDKFRCPIDAVTPEGIKEFIKGINGTLRTKNNYRRTLSIFFNWVTNIKRLITHSPVKATKAFRLEPAEPEVFTPDEMVTLLKLVKDSHILPFVLIGGFAGVRAAEIRRLSWEDIDWEEKHIRLAGKITKTSRRRTANMPENLIKWLTPFKNRTGKIVEVAVPNGTLRRTIAGKMKWKQNALRHSYISYSMAIVRNAADVAEQSGNSEAEVQRSYKALVSKQDAEKWFAINPE